MKVDVKKINLNAKLPTKGSQYAAGYDLYACIDRSIIISPGETTLIPTGLSIAVPIGYAGFIYARSGLATKQGLRPANCVGICDSDYRGEYIVALHNDSNTEKEIYNGDRIAQLIIAPITTVEFNLVNELNETGRGIGGFGSTGK